MALSTAFTGPRDLQLQMVRVREIVERQFGAIARWQLLEAGVTDTQIRKWLRAGRMFRRYPGVYAWGRRDLPKRGELAAALLFAGRGAGLTGLTGLWWCKLLRREPHPKHVAAPGHSRSRKGLRISHPALIERTMRDDIPVTDLGQMLAFASTELDRDSLRLVLARAEFEDMLSLTALRDSLGRGISGSSALRAAIDAHLPQLARCSNGFERDFVLLCERFGLPIPEPNVPKGRFVPDMTWEGNKLIVELDGKGAHRTPAQRARDRKRQEWLEERGYTVIRFTWAQVQFSPGWVAQQVAEALAL